MNPRTVRNALMLLAAAGSLAATPAQALEVKVATAAHRLFADAGESGAGFAASAMITVVVTADGVPVSDLGASVPLGGSEIALPAGWQLRSSFVAPPGPVGIACAFSPTQFTNRGAGLYTIRVAPLLAAPECRWGLGDYQYTVRLATPKVQGVGLGVLTIPDTPSIP
jgi:hypothetical protein